MLQELSPESRANIENRSYDQTIDEWVEENTNGGVLIPAAWKANQATIAAAAPKTVHDQRFPPHLNACSVTTQAIAGAQFPRLFYDTFRTTRNGTLAIVLTDRVSDLEYIAWFNVSTTPQRGDRKTKCGHKGYFYPKDRSKFRKFWRKDVCRNEDVWGSVYRRLPSIFSALVFTGSIELASDSKGSEYIKVNDLRVLKPTNDQGLVAPMAGIRPTQHKHCCEINSALWRHKRQT